MRTHEHELEAAPGLPELLPPGERVLWQGAPDARLLALRAYHLHHLTGYFGLMLALQALFMDGQAAELRMRSLAVSGVLALVALALLGAVAWLAAKTTLYTLTNRRVVMRIGIVLTITLNLPYRRIAAASIKPIGSGSGDIALELSGNTRIAWLQLWPHARPWRLGRPQPTLRCLPRVDDAAGVLTEAWQAAHPGWSATSERTGAVLADRTRSGGTQAVSA
ncbi:MAG: PH domain-containing protein [Rhodoferax sp.]|nr:PH domain-containing protein [Rhodoferax sp.]